MLVHVIRYLRDAYVNNNNRITLKFIDVSNTLIRSNAYNFVYFLL